MRIRAKKLKNSLGPRRDHLGRDFNLSLIYGAGLSHNLCVSLLALSSI